MLPPVRDLDRTRTFAEVIDPTWTPPPAPEDSGDSFEVPRDGWPSWVRDVGVGEMGSCWRASADLQIVAPEGVAYPTLAILRARPSTRNRYWLPIGTMLELLAAEDPEARPSNMTMADWYRHEEGWRMKQYRVLAGDSQGVRVWLSCSPASGRFPLSTLLAHAALVPAGRTSDAPCPEVPEQLTLLD